MAMNKCDKWHAEAGGWVEGGGDGGKCVELHLLGGFRSCSGSVLRKKNVVSLMAALYNLDTYLGARFDWVDAT